MGFAMAIVAPKGRKHLSADALFRLVRSGFATLPDYRQSDTDIALPDALMSAFAMFSLKSPSLLAFDKILLAKSWGGHAFIHTLQRGPQRGKDALALVESPPTRRQRAPDSLPSQ